MKRIILLCLFSVLAMPVTASADIVNLVQNGEFETPDVSGFAGVSVVPGWTSSGGLFELWDQGFLGSPAIGSDGQPTGQHMEMDVDVSPPTFSQSFVIPGLVDNTATFSFDAWLRSAGTSEYSVTGSISGTLIDVTPIASNQSNWTLNSQVLNVVAGETITVFFIQGTVSGESGSHVDNVEFTVNAIPEPSATLLLLTAVIIEVGRRTRIRRFS
jgi:hypothetical protein